MQDGGNAHFPSNFVHKTMKTDIIFLLSICILVFFSIFLCVTRPVSEGMGTVEGLDDGIVFALLSFFVFMAYIAYIVRRK